MTLLVIGINVRVNWLYVALAVLILSGGGYVVYTQTRGLRNNNPGNIKKAGGNKLVFLGEQVSSDPTFAQFDTMDNGIRAVAKIMYTYHASYNLDTVRGIITRWSATDQDAYIANVSDALGVGPDDTVSFKDSLFDLVKAIIHQENGPAGYFISDAVIQRGIDKAQVTI
jgi:hypothetical protein